MKRTKFFLIPTKGRDRTNSAKQELEPAADLGNLLMGSMFSVDLATFLILSLEAVLEVGVKRNEAATFNTE